MERYHLAKDRICEICTEKSAQPDFEDFFKAYGGIPDRKQLLILERQTTDQTEEELMQENRDLYEELFPENYGSCYGNPSYAAEKLGDIRKGILSSCMQNFAV